MTSQFVVVGENIHCTRIFKVGGKNVQQGPDGAWFIAYKADGQPARLTIPPVFTTGADWANGRLKHCAVAIWQARQGDGACRAEGLKYLRALAREQEKAGANYLDVNVDEFSTDLEERREVIRWTVRAVQDAVAVPVSVDSSNTEVLRAGLEACDRKRGRPMVNSVSLERAGAIALAREFNAVVIASAAGRSDLPNTTAGRLENFAELVPVLKSAGFADGDLHLDPLVFPISTDSNNGKSFLDAVAAVRKAYGPGVHIVAGLSNVSFGMPNRPLINIVFTRLACDAGADGGIVDPLQISKARLDQLDTKSEGFRLARAMLMGEDEFGMEYIAASRDGRV